MSWYFANAGIHAGERDAVEGEVPGREPGVLPGVRHRHDVEGVEVPPASVSAGVAARRRRGLGGVAFQPPRDVVVVELLAPQHPGERLAKHQCLVGRGGRRRELGVELVRLLATRRDDGCEPVAEQLVGRRRHRLVARLQAKPQRRRWRPRRRRARTRTSPSCPTTEGLTVGAPLTTWSLMPSFGYAATRPRAAAARGVRLVVAHERRRVARRPGSIDALSWRAPSQGWWIVIVRAPSTASEGRSASSSHDQVLRNHAVGSTCSTSGSGPTLVTSISHSTSVGSAFA